MDLLIKHGTWIIAPVGLVLSLVYLYAYPKIYPFLVARSLKEEDALGRAPQAVTPEVEPHPRPFEAPQPARSRA